MESPLLQADAESPVKLETPTAPAAAAPPRPIGVFVLGVCVVLVVCAWIVDGFTPANACKSLLVVGHVVGAGLASAWASPVLGLVVKRVAFCFAQHYIILSMAMRLPQNRPPRQLANGNVVPDSRAPQPLGLILLLQIVTGNLNLVTVVFAAQDVETNVVRQETTVLFGVSYMLFIVQGLIAGWGLTRGVHVVEISAVT